MIESHLNEGNQKISSNMKYGVSITDACINFEETIQQLEKLNSAIQKVVEEIEATSENFLAHTGIYKFISQLTLEDSQMRTNSTAAGRIGQ